MLTRIPRNWVLFQRPWIVLDLFPDRLPSGKISTVDHY